MLGNYATLVVVRNFIHTYLQAGSGQTDAQTLVIRDLKCYQSKQETNYVTPRLNPQRFHLRNVARHHDDLAPSGPNLIRDGLQLALCSGRQNGLEHVVEDVERTFGRGAIGW